MVQLSPTALLYLQLVCSDHFSTLRHVHPGVVAWPLAEHQ